MLASAKRKSRRSSRARAAPKTHMGSSSSGVSLDAINCVTVRAQDKRCSAPDFVTLPPCLSCMKNYSGEHCRFRKNRLVAWSKDGTVRSLESFASGAGFRLAQCDLDGSPSLGAVQRNACHILRHACDPLMSTLLNERRLVPDDATITIATSQLKAGSADPTAETRAAVEHTNAPGEKQICDWCHTTILCYYCTCPHCGFEACAACTDEFKSTGRPGAPQGNHLACPHPVTSWHYFSRYSPKVLNELMQAAEFWCKEQKRLDYQTLAAEHGCSGTRGVTRAISSVSATTPEAIMPSPSLCAGASESGLDSSSNPATASRLDPPRLCLSAEAEDVRARAHLHIGGLNSQALSSCLLVQLQPKLCPDAQTGTLSCFVGTRNPNHRRGGWLSLSPKVDA